MKLKSKSLLNRHFKITSLKIMYKKIRQSLISILGSKRDRVADNQMRVKQYLQAHGVTQPAPDQRLSAVEAKYERARLKKRLSQITQFWDEVRRDPNFKRLQQLLHKVGESNEITMGNLFEAHRIKQIYQFGLVGRRHQLLNWEHKLQVTLTDTRMVDILWASPDTEKSRRVQRHASMCLDILERVKGPFRKAFAISKSPPLLEVLGYDKNGPNPGRELEVLDQMELYTHPLDGYPVENLPSQHPLDILPFELEPNGDLTVPRYLRAPNPDRELAVVGKMEIKFDPLIRPINHFASLPDELMVQILAFIPFEEREDLENVSRQFERIIMDSKAYRDDKHKRFLQRHADYWRWAAERAEEVRQITLLNEKLKKRLEMLH